MKRKKLLVAIAAGCLVALVGMGFYVYRNEKAQLSIQVAAASHLKTILPLLPENMIDETILEKYDDLVDRVITNTSFKLVSHEKKTNKTGIAVITVTVPEISDQLIEVLATSTDEEVKRQLMQVRSKEDITIDWMLPVLEKELSQVNFKNAKKQTIQLEVPTYEVQANVWSFSKDAIEEVSGKLLNAMGFDSLWQEELYRAIP